MSTGVRFAFASFELDSAKRRLTRSGEPVAVTERQLDVLALLAGQAGRIVAKDDLIKAGWKDVAVGDNSLEQVISGLRRLLGTQPDGSPFIETVARRGYRFTAAVARTTARESDAGLEALLAPYRAFLEGRAALESLEGHRVAGAREVFAGVVRSAPEYASAHIGLANACVMQFEATRADRSPDLEALTIASRHSREACRLDPQSGEAWATLGFVLDRTGNNVDARAAASRAVTLEPDNWRHHFRLAYVSWGEERLRAAHRTLALLPDFPLAHWLAATVHVARQVLSEAERELDAGLRAEVRASEESKFSSVALHWMTGLIHLARDDRDGALAHFEQELAREGGGHLYARECAANTWYAIGALRLRQGRRDEARRAFEQTIARVERHALARLGIAAAGSASFGTDGSQGPGGPPSSIDASFVAAARHSLMGSTRDAASAMDAALAAAPAGSAGWLLPIEPLLNVAAHPDEWQAALARLRSRAV